MRKTIVIAGGTGFLGDYLVHFFQKQYSIVVLTRKESVAKNRVDYVHWDGKELGLERQALEPVRNPIEMHANWNIVAQKLQEQELRKKQQEKV